MTEILSRFARYFLQGLIFLVPLAIIVYVIWQIWDIIESNSFTDSPWISLLIIVFVITTLGYLASSLIARPIFKAIEKVLTKAPVINFIYSSIKDLLEAFVGDKKRFDKPVIVTISRDSHLKKLGFITAKDMKMIDEDGMVAVYMPHSYNFSGNLFVVDKEHVRTLDANSAEVMKFIVSGGVSGLSDEFDPKKFVELSPPDVEAPSKEESTDSDSPA